MKKVIDIIDISMVVVSVVAVDVDPESISIFTELLAGRFSEEFGRSRFLSNAPPVCDKI